MQLECEASYLGLSRRIDIQLGSDKAEAGLHLPLPESDNISLPSNKVVLISGLSTIKEVYTHKASADKPPMVLNATRNYLLSDGQAINLGLLGGNGQTWQELRRFVLRHLRDFGFGKTSCEPLIVKEVTELMDHIQQQEGQPIVMKRLFNRSVVNVVWRIVMGKRFPHDDAKVAKVIETFLQPADTNLIHPLFFIPGMAKTIVYLPIWRNITKSLRDLATFIKVKYLGGTIHESSKHF
nr:cytochrome P450 2D15-like [Cherax quadricarinatus]